MKKLFKITLITFLLFPFFSFIILSNPKLRNLAKRVRNKILTIGITKKSKYENVYFGDYYVEGCTPSKDTINDKLLKDISTAAVRAKVKVTITTAKTGHRPGTRHEQNNAVDIAIINGHKIKNQENAIDVGIFDDMDRFVNELQNIGYRKNKSERINRKCVLTFGVKDHDNHIHISRR